MTLEEKLKQAYEAAGILEISSHGFTTCVNTTQGEYCFRIPHLIGEFFVAAEKLALEHRDG